MKTKILSQFYARFRPAKSVAGGPAPEPFKGAGDPAQPATAPPETAYGPTGVLGRLGYTLIELICALAIMVILAAMLVPVAVSQIEIAAVNAETTSLATLNSGLVFGVQHNFQIPCATNWAPVLAQWLGLPATGITTNARGYQRIYVYDTNGFGSLALPYTQTIGLASLPANPRLMLVSSISTNLPDASGPLSTAEFNAIWNTAPGNIPYTWTTNWHGKGADLLIQRINLMPLFDQVILSAVDTNIFGNFVVMSGTNSTTPIYVLTNSPSTNFYIQGTVIGLYDTNNPPTQNLESQYVVHACNSWVFEDQAWRGELMGWGTNGPASWLSATLIFTNTTVSQVAQTYITCQKSFKGCQTDYNDGYANYNGDSCQAVSDCFDSFILHYNSWCHQGFSTGGNSACNQLNQDLNQCKSITQNMCQ